MFKRWNVTSKNIAQDAELVHLRLFELEVATRGRVSSQILPLQKFPLHAFDAGLFTPPFKPGIVVFLNARISTRSVFL